MLSDLPTKLLIPHTGCCYKWAYTQGIDTSQPYWSRLPGRQGGARGNKFIISFPSSPYPISFPAITWPKRIQISNQIAASSFIRHLTWLLRWGNRFYLRWVKLERQPIGQRFCLGHDVSVYCFPTVMKKVKVILAWLWCPIFQMIATRWRASKVLGYLIHRLSVQFSSVAQSCPTLCDPMDFSMPSLPVRHHLLELTQTHVNWVGDTIQASHPLLSPSPPTLNLSQHQGLFQWVSSSHQVFKILEFQLQYQSI